MFNRMFASLIALVWCGLLAASLVLIWQPSKSAVIDNTYFHFRLSVPVTGSDQILATVIVGALIGIGVMFLAMQLMPWKSRERVYTREGSPAANTDAAGHFQSLERRLDDLQRRVEGNQRTVVDRTGSPRPAEEQPHRHWGIFGARRTS